MARVCPDMQPHGVLKVKYTYFHALAGLPVVRKRWSRSGGSAKTEANPQGNVHGVQTIRPASA